MVDVGGTTSDIGVLTHGYPRESSLAVEIGEVRTNFRMPDILALAIGGGTKVRFEQQRIELGPESVGHTLTQTARSFGGDELTLTDIALKTGQMQWQAVHQLSDEIGVSAEQASKVYQQMVTDVEEGIDKMKTSAANVPVIMVGGGSALFPDHFEGVSQVVRPEHFEVANAIGVALGEISGQFDKIVPIEPASREETLKRLRRAIKATGD